MKMKTFGRTGFTVSQLGLGAWGIGSKHYGTVAEKDAFGTLDAYIEAGGNLIDTARGYHNSESIIGRWMKERNNREVFAQARDAGVALVGRTVLENGFLAGKYKPGHTFPPGFPDGDHRSRWNGRQLDRILTEADQLKDMLAQPPLENLAQAALRFALDQEGLSVVLAGAKSMRQARANAAVTGLPELSADIHARLSELYEGKEDLVNL